MAKLTLYFKNQAEYDAYWGDQTPGSGFICVIENLELPDGDVVTNSALTTTNNIGDDFVVSNVGASALSYSYNLSYAYDILQASYTDLWNSYVTATGISEETLNGEEEPQQSTIEIYDENN